MLRIDLSTSSGEAGERSEEIAWISATPISIERVGGPAFDDILLGHAIQKKGGGSRSYVERLAGGEGDDLLRGFGGDDLVPIDGLARDGQEEDGGAGVESMVYSTSFAVVISTFETGADGWSARISSTRPEDSTRSASARAASPEARS